jgi:hypothetical protein
MPIRGKRFAFIALIAYFWLATPWQVILWYLNPSRAKYSGWLLVLNCGAYLEAIAILAAMAVMRARFSSGGSAPPSERPVGSRRYFILVAIVAGLAASLAWWYVFRFAGNYSGLRNYIFGLSYVPGYNQLQAAVSYYRFFSIFIVTYLGILAGDVAWRWSPERRLLPYPPPKTKPSDSDFIWTSWVAWLGLYRLLTESIYLFFEVTFANNSVVSLDGWYLSFLPLVATSIACILVSMWLKGRTPRTRESSIYVAMAASLLIPVIATSLLITTGFLALGPLALCVVSMNGGGFLWGWFVGDLRWRSFQPQPATPDVEKGLFERRF